MALNSRRNGLLNSIIQIVLFLSVSQSVDANAIQSSNQKGRNEFNDMKNMMCLLQSFRKSTIRRMLCHCN